MNIHLPAILGFTRYQGFDPSPYVQVLCMYPSWVSHFNSHSIDFGTGNEKIGLEQLSGQVTLLRQQVICSTKGKGNGMIQQDNLALPGIKAKLFPLTF